MKKLIEGIKKYLEPLFILSVFILVVVEFKILSKEISYDKVASAFQGLSPAAIALMFVVGILSVLPMVNYDVIFNRLIENEEDKRYIFETSYTINTMNNLIGFGGLINMGLRHYFYGRKKDKLEMVKVVLETYFYYLIGISLLCLLALCYLYFHRDSMAMVYLPWLIGGVLYSPAVLLFSNRKKEEKKRVPHWAQAQLLLTSLLEWLGAIGTFLLIGRAMGLSFHVTEVFTIVVGTNLIGMVSLMPGGLGSFDLMTLVGLGNLGLGYENVLAWLLLYRLFYYVVPFTIGLYFFVKHFGHNFNEENDGLPARFAKSIGHDLCSAMMYIFGIFMILSATIPDKVNTVKFLADFNPIHANILYQYPSILLGLVFIFLGRIHMEQQKKAMAPTLLFLALTFVYAVMTGFGLITYLYLIVLTVLTVTSRRDLYREQFIYRGESLLMDLGIGMVFVTVYLLSIANKARGTRPLLKAKDFLVVPFEKNWLRISVMLLLIAAVLYAIFRYVKGDGKTVGERADPDRAEALLKAYGGDMDAGLVFLGDKDLYWYCVDEEDVCAIQLKTVGDKVIVMGEPMGNRDYIDDCVKQFIRDVDVLGYDLVFYEVSRDLIMKLHDYGFHFMKFGEAAIVDLEDFTLEGKSKKAFRNVLNKFEKENVRFEILQPPYDERTMERFRSISDKWLKNRGEKGFSLGFFDEGYLNRGPVAVVKEEEEIVAFANCMPVYKDGWATIDLMRYDPDRAPAGTMDFLFLNLFLHFKEEGKVAFDLGMAPLSNVGMNEHSFLQEKLAYFVYTFGSAVYSFEGLRSYKSKYAAYWEAKYTGYSHRSSLLFTVLSLVRADRLSGGRKES
ncbi:MAG: bifunctional lysylphosphatidylglycerol flippase/synthetase MprF [Peptoniphilus sp.]|nr:bifunctional lysylphosphatidylglycerol flippase/synthetase MprF [Peptoniphilus sp.]MDY3117934.1 bifunctional lysylphosphatidylglycerol flippase/synthetase MprF [Peptoniphilus sp.]